MMITEVVVKGSKRPGRDRCVDNQKADRSTFLIMIGSGNGKFEAGRTPNSAK